MSSSTLYALPELPDKYDVIPLPDGYMAVVDAEDIPKLLEYKWHVHRKWDGIPNAVMGRRKGSKKLVYLHRVILDLSEDDPEVDHISGFPLDNRKINLRLATRSQQLANRTKETNRKTSSQYKGVTWHKTNKRWIAQIKINQKRYHLGCFINEEDAAKAYDKAAKEAFGEFARPNFAS